MPELTTSAPRTLIISNNMVEADDLTEMLTGLGLGPVLHARDVMDATGIVARSGQSLRLMMCGLSLHLHGVAEFLASVDRSSLSLVVIDGPAEFSQGDGAGLLFRPFSTRDVMAALARLGLPD